jgi:phosphoserine phosphatase
MKLKLDRNGIYKWLTNTTNNILASVIASVIFSFLLGSFLDNITIGKNTTILYSLIFALLVVIIFLIIKNYSNKKFIPIKAIVFGFDGAMSRIEKNEVNSPWELIWLTLGYKVSDCHKYHKMFSKGEISHENWCNITCEKFQERGITENHLNEVSEDIVLLDGVKDVLDLLKRKGIKLYLATGSIKQIIERVWGKNIDYYFERVESNIFRFKNGELKEIKGTHYDFEGKIELIKEIRKRLKLTTSKEILFVGSYNNDEFAHKSGARTLCVNAKLTNPHDKNIWHETYTVKDYRELYDFIEKKYLLND